MHYIIINDINNSNTEKKNSDVSIHPTKSVISDIMQNRQERNVISITTNRLSNGNNLKVKSQSLISPLGLISYSTYSNNITITNNSQFPSFGFSGSGTLVDPYVLSNKNFTYLGSLKYTIFISNTNAYFVIKDSIVSSGLNKFVHLTNVSNAFLLNNTVTDMYYPYYIEGPSSNITISNNTLTAGSYGVDGIIDYSSIGSITIFNNTIKNFSNSGILIAPLNKNNIVENNTVENNLQNGIIITSISNQNINNSITNNNLKNNYFYLQTTSVYSITLNQFTFSNNYVNNLPVDFINNMDKPTFDIHPAQIIVFNSSNVTIANIHAFNGPFIVANSKNVIISNITISNSIYTGMELNFDDNITVTNNSIVNTQGEGIKLFSFSNATVTSNTLSGSITNCVGACYGLDIKINGENSTISYNNIENYVYGIYLFGYTNVVIQGNIIKNSTAYAMYITTKNYGSTLKSFKDNSFYNNSIQLSSLPPTTEFTNNTYDNEPIIILKNIQNQILTPGGSIPNVYGQLYLQNVIFVELKNLEILYDLCVSTSTNFTLNNVVIRDHGLSIIDSSNTTLENNVISSTTDGIYSQPSTYYYNLVIRNNTIIGKPSINPSTNGIYIAGWSNVLIENNTIKYFSTGVLFSQVQNSKVINNNLYYSDGPSSGGIAGVYLTYAQSMNNYIANNNIKYFYQGIYVNYNVVYFNEFYNNTLSYGYYGLKLQSANASFDNNIISFFTIGIYLTGATYNTFTNNKITNSSNDQLYLTQSSFNVFASNNFTFTQFYKNVELISSSVNNIFIGNNFTYNNNFMHFDPTSGNNTVKNNIFLDTLYVALKIESSNNVISNNDFIGNNWTNMNYPPGKQILVTNPNNIVLGNYYSDHSNLDFNWDNIADSPYTNFGSSLIDPYPRIRPIFMPDIIAPLLFILPGNNSIFDGNGFILSYNISERSNAQIYINSVLSSLSIINGINMAHLILGDGTYNITLEATDLAGNVAIISTTIIVDAIAPIINFISPTTTIYNNLSVNVSYSIIEKSNYTLTIYVNGAINNTVLLNNTEWTFQDGLNNITFIAIDQVGNITVKSVFFTVDVSPPVLTIFSPTNTTYSIAEIIIDYTIFDYSGYNTTIYLDGNANTTIENPGYRKILGDGYYNITFVVIDAFNQTTIQSVYFSLDILPTVDIYSLANTTYSTNELMLNYTYLYATTIKIYNDSVLIQGVVPNGTLFYFIDGYHNITIVATDSLNRIAISTVIFLIDTKNPVIVINSPQNTTYSNGTFILNYQITEINSNITQIKIDGVVNSTSITNGSAIHFAAGPHNITIKVTDIAGNIDVKTVNFSITTTSSTATSSSTSTTSIQSSGSQSSSSQTSGSSTNSSTIKISPIPFLPIILGLVLLTALKFRFRIKRNSK